MSSFSAHIINHVMTIALTLLYAFADPVAVAAYIKEHPSTRELSPETTSSFFNRMIFFWFTRMIIIGYKRGIEMTDVWDLNPRDTSRVLMARFNQLWQQEVRRFHRFSLNFVPVKYISDKKKRLSKTTSSTKETLKADNCESLPLLGNKISETMQNNGSLTSVTSATESCLTDSKPAPNQSPVQGTQYQTLVQNPAFPSGKLDRGLEESVKDKVSFRQNESQQTKDHTTSDAPSLTKVLVKQFAGQMTVLLIQRLLSDAFFIVTTLVFGELITHLNSRRPGQEWQGYVLALTLFVCGLLRAVFYACSNYRAYYTGLQIKSVVIGAVYCKALRINNATRKTATIGEVVNLMAVDAQRLQEFISRLFFGMTIPFLLVAVVALMYIRVGVSAFAGIVLLLLLVPLNGLVGVLQKRFQIRNLTNKDKRVKLINEILNGIKVVKLYAWEPSLERRVNDVRDQEISSLLKVALLHMVLGLCWSIVPFLVTLATYGTFVLVENDNFLTTSDAFVIMSLFQILAPPLDYLSLLISFTVQAKVSVGRINKFLCSEERDNTMVTQESHSNNAVCIEDASLTWDDIAKPTLENINLKIPEGRLVAVVGQAGAGKSSLINAILGEMTKTRGHIAVKGAIAYVPQQAWIQNATVRDNVLFGKAYQAERYKTVIRACQLERDLSILPAGDLTEIGEKGTNLSGGQKQRVSLARAVYSDRDVYLLDDPLSAVDSHVGKALFRDVIGPQGLLKGKTRVLVTHGVHWLPLVEEVVVLRGGRIVETGSYSELMLYNGHLAQFLRSCLLDFNQPLQVYRADHQEEVENESSTDEEVMTMEKKIFEDVTSDAYSSGNETYEHFRKRKRKDKLERRRLSQAPMLSSVKESSQVGEDDVDEEAGKLVMTEKLLKGRVSTSVYLAHPKAGGLLTVLLGIASFFAFQATSVVANFWLRDWTEDPLLNNQSSWGSEEFVQRNYFYLLCYGMFGIAQVFFLIVFNYLHWTRAVRASKRLHERLINRLLQAPMAFFDTTPLGRIMNRVSSDMEIVDNIVPVVIRDNLFTFGVLVATLVVISIISPFIIIFLVLLAIFIYFAFVTYIPTSRQCRRMESVTRSPIFAHLSETMSGVATIRAYKATDRFISISESRVDTNQTYFYGYIAGLRWCQMLMDTLTFIMVFLAAVLEVVASDSSGGSVGLSVSYALQLSYRMTSLARLATDFETNVVAVERVKEYSEVETEAPWFVDTYRPDLNWPSRGEVELKDLTVRYRPKLPLVLKGLNCVLRGGEKIGVVGRTGAGKSSLSLALFRLVEPAGGTIVIDGVNIALVGLHQLRTRITILPQDPVLFSGTLRFNLDPTGGRSDEALWKALKQAHLQHLVQSLPGGLDFNCGDEGANLSVGQRQLVCLARTLLKKTHLLVLDEATAAVDMETDALIQKTVREAFSDCTVITIAHRLHTVMDYDRIMVLDSGRIVEFDTPQRLMNSPHSAFANMIKDAEMTGKL
ncbi:hypothetical protein C0Q70_04114 [Pomacea canaliculata]|uniref:Uncharacterized protein n=1 Tax=Pomacea canaliculata TaxID=400727 RepID=A0A2T7PUN2_POMCA|nr:hypothetical protein C0Q70_04114 [Pomacea canaliculata]